MRNLFENAIYEIFPNLRKIELGMRIKVVYDKDDYYNNIWDNIIDIEILSEDSL